MSIKNLLSAQAKPDQILNVASVDMETAQYSLDIAVTSTIAVTTQTGAVLMSNVPATAIDGFFTVTVNLATLTSTLTNTVLVSNYENSDATSSAFKISIISLSAGTFQLRFKNVSTAITGVGNVGFFYTVI